MRNILTESKSINILTQNELKCLNLSMFLIYNNLLYSERLIPFILGPSDINVCFWLQ